MICFNGYHNDTETEIYIHTDIIKTVTLNEIKIKLADEVISKIMNRNFICLVFHRLDKSFSIF